MAETVIWHNPRCSKSRETLALLRARGVEPVLRHYLESPPDADEIRAALSALGRPAIDLVRRGEPRFRALGLAAGDSDDWLVAAMAAEPILIERPLVIRNGRAVLGRPPAAVLALL